MTYFLKADYTVLNARPSMSFQRRKWAGGNLLEVVRLAYFPNAAETKKALPLRQNLRHMASASNKKKIFNDPIYGFVSIPDELHFDIIEHPYFQRLRRIKQVSMTNLVYPGANHTRFAHSLGAMHLMRRAIQLLRGKGYEITDEELEASFAKLPKVE